MRPPFTPHAPLPTPTHPQVTTTSAKAGGFEARFYHKIFTEEFGNVRGHFGPINSVAFSPDGRSFVTGGEDGYVRIHHFDMGEQQRPLGLLVDRLLSWLASWWEGGLVGWKGGWHPAHLGVAMRSSRAWNTRRLEPATFDGGRGAAPVVHRGAKARWLRAHN